MPPQTYASEIAEGDARIRLDAEPLEIDVAEPIGRKFFPTLLANLFPKPGSEYVFPHSL
ncbi:hypothetical protein N789_11775 [Arenimonas oryziterrae DSM 21050 = YC6267]|uniref:Uncharacterized protein n=1 Tax=Arenimonas oryziterrae DSM 21050 = YC6267 TaxID=1121015 RepID=A0A091AU99_9GAMM|nr:hypothetical protein N789_11775 [Arenimonas oryziterrae DSM 21050 = YC6267]